MSLKVSSLSLTYTASRVSGQVLRTPGEEANVKALYRRGLARASLRELRGARADLEAAAALAPGEAPVRKLLLQVKQQQKLKQAAEKRRWVQALAGARATTRGDSGGGGGGGGTRSGRDGEGGEVGVVTATS